MIGRLKYVIARVYQKKEIEIAVYGSLVTGLSLPDSDVDLQIKGLGNLNRLQIENKLKQLFAVLANFSWIKKSSQMILTSQIPIIKLDIDCKVDFYQQREEGQSLFSKEEEEGEGYQRESEEGKEECEEIQIDISIDNQQFFNLVFFQNNNNVGQYSTQYVVEQLKQYPDLKDVTLFIKQILNERGLNKTIDGILQSIWKED